MASFAVISPVVCTANTARSVCIYDRTVLCFMHNSCAISLGDRPACRRVATWSTRCDNGFPANNSCVCAHKWTRWVWRVSHTRCSQNDTPANLAATDPIWPARPGQSPAAPLTIVAARLVCLSPDSVATITAVLRNTLRPGVSPYIPKIVKNNA